MGTIPAKVSRRHNMKTAGRFGSRRRQLSEPIETSPLGRIPPPVVANEINNSH